jgi:hypothetical protein
VKEEEEGIFFGIPFASPRTRRRGRFARRVLEEMTLCNGITPLVRRKTEYTKFNPE